MNMKKKLTLLLMIITGCCAVASAQARKGLRINEVMVVNENNFVDDYGQRGAWVELFNSNFSPLEISSVFLTNDPSRPTLYPVPLGDVNTRIPKRQHIVFWADGMPSRGTFHMNFTLDPENPIGLACMMPTGARSSTPLRCLRSPPMRHLRARLTGWGQLLLTGKCVPAKWAALSLRRATT